MKWYKNIRPLFLVEGVYSEPCQASKTEDTLKDYFRQRDMSLSKRIYNIYLKVTIEKE